MITDEKSRIPDEDSTASPGFDACGDTTDESQPQTVGAAWHEVFEKLAQLRDYGSHLLAARRDLVRLKIRKVVILTALVLLGAIIAVSVLVAASVLLVTGIAEGLTAMFGGLVWAGDLGTAVLLLGGVAGGAFLVLRKMAKSSRERTAAAYERRTHEQRQRYGQDVGQCAGKREA